MATITSTSCGNSTIVQGAGTTPNNSYYLNSNPSGFITSSDVAGRFIGQRDSLPSGSSLYRINFPTTLSSVPSTVVTELLNSGSGMASFTSVIRGIDTAGFYIEFANTLGTGYSLMSNYISGSTAAGAFITLGGFGGGNSSGITYLNGLTGSVNLVGVNNTIYTSGNNIVISGSASGSVDTTNLVFKTGAQAILGRKSFGDFLDIYSGFTAYQSNLTPIINVNSQSGSFKLYYPDGFTVFMDNTGIFRSAINSIILNVNSGALYDNSLNVALDWDDRQLSGQWQSNVNPSISGHIVNKGYIDSVTGRLQPSGNYATGVIAGTNITVSNNGSGGFTVNSSAAGGGNVISVAGLTGVIGITGVNNVTSYLSGNTVVLSGISTGSFADQSYINNASGALSTRLQTTGSTLLGLIQAASAGVSSLNGSSGIMTLAGAGYVSVTTVGQAITVSGNTSIPITGFINGPSGSSGIASGIVNNQIQFYGLTGSTGVQISSNSGVGALVFSVTGVVFNSQTGSFVTTGQTGQFYSTANPSNYVTAAQTGFLTGSFYPLNSNPSGYVVSSSTGAFLTTGQTGNFYSISNPSGYISYASVGGVQTLNITGSLVSGGITLTGAGNVTISKSGQIVSVSGDTSLLATSANLASTGSNLQSQVNTNTTNISTLNGWTGITTGLYYPRSSNPSGYITTGQTGAFGGGNVTSIAGLTGVIGVTGVNNISTYVSGNTVIVSGQSSASSETWNTVTGDTTIVINNSYIVNGTGLVNLTLPTTFTLGNPFHITSISDSGWKVSQNSGQSIRFGNTITTSGVSGYIQSTSIGDSIRLVCVNSNSGFMILNSVGNIIIN